MPTIESYRKPLPLIEEETETETERQSLSPEPDWNDYLTQPGSLAQSQTLPEPLIQFESLSLRMAQESGTTAAAVPKQRNQDEYTNSLHREKREIGRVLD